MRPDWPSNEVTAEIVKANGDKFEWRHNAPNPEDRPLDVQFGSKLMEGYSDASCSLARREALGSDLGLYDTLRFIDAYGKVVYEGRITDFAEDSSGDSPRVHVAAAGWMTHARDRAMLPALYVDRDPSNWQGASQKRRDQLEEANAPASDPEVTEDSEARALRFVISDEWEAPQTPRVEALYDAGPGQKVARVYATFSSGVSPAAFVLEVGAFSGDRIAGEGEFGADLYTAASGTIAFEPATPQRYVDFCWRPAATPGGESGGEYPLSLLSLAVYGDHGLPRYGEEPGGLLVSDMIAHSAGLYAPLLDTSGVEESSHVVDQAAESELADPYDFWLKLNKYERWNLAVWEDRKLTYQPFDPDAVDWRVRDGDDGVTVKWNGESTSTDFNGIIIRFQNIDTGRADMVTPEEDSRLRDEDPSIAANEHGLEAWTSVQLPDPDTREGAIRYAQLVLEELNRQRQPGTITVRGCIRDGARHWRPGHHPRAGENVLVEDLGGGPRQITEPRWDAESETLTMTVDGQAETADAILDQILTEQKLRSQ